MGNPNNGIRLRLETLMSDATKPSDVAPHPPLLQYYGVQEERAGYVRGLFDRSARHYDRINAFMSFGSGRRYRREMLVEAGLKGGMRVLDVAIGTGQVAREARRLLAGNGLVVGLDASPGMLAEARRANAADILVMGQAEALPFADESFDFVSIGYALRHVSNLGSTLRELRRMLRPGGSLLILELSRPDVRISRALLKIYLGWLLPLASRVTTGSSDAQVLMRYYWDTIEGCVPPETILGEMRVAKFDKVHTDAQFGILRTYIGSRA